MGSELLYDRNLPMRSEFQIERKWERRKEYYLSGGNPQMHVTLRKSIVNGVRHQRVIMFANLIKYCMAL
jgi:hypothetical protein